MIQLLCPVSGARISQYFGENPWRYGYDGSGHHGIDYGVVVGTPVRAAADGTLTAGDQGATGFGLYLRQEIGGGRLYYGHLSHVMKTGTVKAGEAIALSGNTGNSTAPHLHFELRVDGAAVDPLPYLVETLEETMDKPVSKLAVHFQGPPERDTEATELIRASQIQWVKGIDPDSWAENPFPNQRVLARLWIGGDSTEHTYMAQRIAGAEAYFALLKPRYEKLKAMGIYDVAGPNEPHPDGGNYLDYEAFELRWAQIVAAYGMRPWVWSIGVGWFPGPAGFAVGSIQAAYDAGGGFEVHEYGAPAVMDGGGWWTLRIKKTLAELYAAGLTGCRVFVGECGIDGGVIDWNSAQFAGKKRRRGWRDWADWAYTGEQCCGLPSPHVMDRELYWAQMSWLDDRYCEIPEVVAASPFVTCPNADWVDFDWDGEMIRRTAAKYATAPTPAPYLPHIVEANVWEPAVVLEKTRWWLEEMQRQFESGNTARADEIRLSLIEWMYQRENALKTA
jgi:hypothetical protein